MNEKEVLMLDQSYCITEFPIPIGIEWRQDNNYFIGPYEKCPV